MTTAIAAAPTAALTAAAAPITWATINACRWQLMASEGNQYLYHCPELAEVDARLVIEFSGVSEVGQWAEIEFAYYLDNTGAEWCYPEDD